MRNSLKRIFLVSLWVLVLSQPAVLAFDFTQLEQAVTEYTLDNGLKLIVMERHESPVASFVTWVDVGGSDDPKEYTGLAHMCEHMAFKGTTTLGTKDIEKEMELMRVEDSIWLELRAERKKGAAADSVRLEQLTQAFEEAIEAANEYVNPNAFGHVVEMEGGVDLNAGTSMDFTMYHMSLPSNKVELWMAVESERFLDPVLREMYRERNVVAEERRMVLENNPISRLIDEIKSASFMAHPYGVSIVGHMSDIQNYSRDAARNHLRKYYVPHNMTVAVVGDVKSQEVYKLAKKYWGRIPAGDPPDRVATVEPEQRGERRVTLQDPAQPFFAAAWHVPSSTDPDWPAIDAMVDYLGQGRTSLLYKSLVKEKKIAAHVGVYNGYPGTKYPCLCLAFAMPASGHNNEECEQEIFAQLEKLKQELLPQEELEKIKARAKAGFIGRLDSNLGMAMRLAANQCRWGDWRELFHTLDRINAVTAEDIQRVAKEYFTEQNRTVGYLNTIEG